MSDDVEYAPGFDFWDDWFRAEDLQTALKTATTTEARILQKALEPITTRQDAYWDARHAEWLIQQQHVQERIAAFSRKHKEQSL